MMVVTKVAEWEVLLVVASVDWKVQWSAVASDVW